MAEETKKVEPECPTEPQPLPPAPAAEPESAEAPKDVAEEKPAVQPPPPPEEKPQEEPKALAVVESNAFRHSTFTISFLKILIEV